MQTLLYDMCLEFRYLLALSETARDLSAEIRISTFIVLLVPFHFLKLQQDLLIMEEPLCKIDRNNNNFSYKKAEKLA